MKKIIFMTMLISSSAFAAVDGSYMCDRHNRAGYLNECLEITSTADFDRKALNQCSRHNRAGYLNECLEIIANVRFNKDVSKCSRHNWAGYLNECLINLGGNKPKSFWDIF
jgi:hypothetical protein